MAEADNWFVPDFNSSGGGDVTDEVIVISEPWVVETVTYYCGWMTYHTDLSLAATADATYGIYTAASRGGSRLTVLDSGRPGTDEIRLVLGAGLLIATTSRTVYVSYRRYGRVVRLADLLVDKAITIPGNMERAAEDEVYLERLPSAQSFSGARLTSLWPAQADLIMTIKRGDGETAGSETITLASGLQDADVTFSAPFAFAALDHIRLLVSANTSGVSNPILTLIRA